MSRLQRIALWLFFRLPRTRLDPHLIAFAIGSKAVRVRNP